MDRHNKRSIEDTLEDALGGEGAVTKRQKMREFGREEQRAVNTVSMRTPDRYTPGVFRAELTRNDPPRSSRLPVTPTEHRRRLAAAVGLDEQEPVFNYGSPINFTTPEKNRPSFDFKCSSTPGSARSSRSSYCFTPNRTGSPTPPRRDIPKTAERILDAPGLKNDYYINVLDWSSRNVVLVGLGSKCYVWDGATQKVEEVFGTLYPDAVSACTFSPDGRKVAVGTDEGILEVFAILPKKRSILKLREGGGIAAVAWSKTGYLAKGDRLGIIKIYDVNRQREPVAVIRGTHHDRIVGLRWSPDGLILASGGNDNLVCLWEISATTVANSPLTPKKILREHRSAVRALAWCPWQYNLLATGGGLEDRKIRFFNTDTGRCIKSVDTGSQVCAIVWSKAYKELISSHHLVTDQLIIWSYPSMEKIARLPGHTQRPLFLAISPDGQTVVSGSGDETLKFWKCFATKVGQQLLRPVGAALHDEPLPAMIR
ncbi:ubiquitin-protein transferase activating protein [Borealophlyctis nickersoniae]|nr:ubiquitin-protein transferase activating protein [Borealophlyctis nickersoniae]